MRSKLNNSRLLIYSHDSFGLGHLRRCRTIAHALVDRYKGLSVLIITGSPIIGRFDFKARVDFIRIPGVIKLHNGEYTSLGLLIDLADTMALRESIILNTSKVFQPDIFLVDKEPGGLKDEVVSTLTHFKDTDTKCILGLRDVMDSPELLKKEWQKKNVMPLLENLYDELWVYGPAEVSNPLQGLDIKQVVTDKTLFTGYLPRQLPQQVDTDAINFPDRPYILVTPGGGGDGIEMIDWVLRAYESSPTLMPALFVLGPFMPATERNDFLRRAEVLPHVDALTFSNHLEHLMFEAEAVIAMGGYNTFCEILSFDKPAMILPRTQPREEQLIRARNAAAVGLLSMLDLDSERLTETMVDGIISLLKQDKPSKHKLDNLLNGLDFVADRFGELVVK
ncbi:glycosyltransferase family protein [Moritella dasanensis]|uniref:glycosyltransferase family protein n=1 Tax=Moritella dasanensis TaxID=428031 RepID=UPI00031C61FD|nr:glycosyltransferase [Moritella dasanensis]